jgi:hypothetical protein
MKLAESFAFNAEGAGSRGGEPPGASRQRRTAGEVAKPVELAGLEHEPGRLCLARDAAGTSPRWVLWSTGARGNGWLPRGLPVGEEVQDDPGGAPGREHEQRPEELGSVEVGDVP